VGFNLDNGVNVLGHNFFDAAKTVNHLAFEYALPIIGILDSGTDKRFSVGNIYSLKIELTMDSFAISTVSATGAGSIGACTISEVEFVGKVIELDAQPQSII